MARIIKKIAFRNFYNYYGDYSNNNYLFKEGLNILVADNGAGKSKFFNGILWIIKDGVFDSDRKKYTDIKSSKFYLISDKAKMEASINDSIIAGVKLEFHHEENGRTYEIIKEVEATKIREGSPTDELNWDITVKEPCFNQKSKMGDRAIYSKSEQEEIIMFLLRPGLDRYSLLQGEEVDEIVDLTNPANLSNTINDLSDVSDIEKISELVNHIASKSEKDYNNALKKSKSFDDNLNNLIIQKNHIEKQLQETNGLLVNAKSSHAREEIKKEQTLSKAESAEIRDKFRKNIEVLEAKLNQIKQDENELINSINGKLFAPQDNWLLYRSNIQEELTEFRKKYTKAKEDIMVEKRVEEKINSILPMDSPDNTSLENMLKQEKCFVCNREAKKDSEAWKHIKSVFDSHTSNRSCNADVFQNDFSKFLDDLYTSHASINPTIGKIKISIINENKRMSQYQKDKNQIDEKLKEIIEQFHSYGGKQDEESALSDRNSVNDMMSIMNNLNRFKNQIDRYTTEIKQLENAKIRLANEIKKRDRNSIEEGYELNRDISQNLKIAISNTRKTIFQEKLDFLEREANLQFKRLTVHNDISGGILKFVKAENDTVSVVSVDDTGNILHGLSEGFQRMRKLAVILAILISNEKVKFIYPFIADAPLSSFGKGFMEGFFEVFGSEKFVIKQSIILVKDLFDREDERLLTEFGHRLLKNNNIGSFYVNQVEKDQDQTQRITKILNYR